MKKRAGESEGGHGGGSRVAFTMGDPHGIGPEVLLKALDSPFCRRHVRPVVFGDEQYLSRLGRDLKLGCQGMKVVSAGPFAYPPPWGRLAAAAGRFALTCLEQAVDYCRRQNIPLLVTAPVNKRALDLAGCRSPGQTELMASFFPDSRAQMAFFSDRFHLLLITAHIPLRQISAALNPADIVEKTRIFVQALQGAGLLTPRVALCGLNPHASEQGLFGDEEARVLQPALKILMKELGAGVVSGPHPPDTVFRRAAGGEFDAVVALYHDQGLIPLKLLAFESAVNVTLGLPLIRTSPAHGTAFDIAGQGIADAGSMLAAIRWGLRLAGRPAP